MAIKQLQLSKFGAGKGLRTVKKKRNFTQNSTTAVHKLPDSDVSSNELFLVKCLGFPLNEYVNPMHTGNH